LKIYTLELTRTEQFWIFWAFSCMLLKFQFLFIPLGKPKLKAPAVGTMLLSGIMLKMGLYSVIRWQLPLAP
jgi:NADH-quinone oxidoreductase subunit M